MLSLTPTRERVGFRSLRVMYTAIFAYYHTIYTNPATTVTNIFVYATSFTAVGAWTVAYHLNHHNTRPTRTRVLTYLITTIIVAALITTFTTSQIRP